MNQLAQSNLDILYSSYYIMPSLQKMYRAEPYKTLFEKVRGSSVQEVEDMIKNNVRFAVAVDMNTGTGKIYNDS